MSFRIRTVAFPHLLPSAAKFRLVSAVKNHKVLKVEWVMSIQCDEWSYSVYGSSGDKASAKLATVLSRANNVYAKCRLSRHFLNTAAEPDSN